MSELKLMEEDIDWIKNMPETEDIQKVFSQLGIEGFESAPTMK